MAEYVISDLHGYHSKLRSRVRTQFTTDKQLAEHIKDNWNKTITNIDIVYVLGDVGTKEFILEYVPQLRGKIVLILGNHDGYSKAFYRENFYYVYNKPFWLTSRILLSHIPQPVEDGKINIHGHTHEICLDLPNYFNVSVEMINYTPVNMKRYYDALGRMEKPNYQFMYEWFAKYQVTKTPRIDIVVKPNGRIDVDKSKRKLAAIKRAKN